MYTYLVIAYVILIGRYRFITKKAVYLLCHTNRCCFYLNSVFFCYHFILFTLLLFVSIYIFKETINVLIIFLVFVCFLFLFIISKVFRQNHFIQLIVWKHYSSLENYCSNKWYMYYAGFGSFVISVRVQIWSQRWYGHLYPNVSPYTLLWDGPVNVFSFCSHYRLFRFFLYKF